MSTNYDQILAIRSKLKEERKLLNQIIINKYRTSQDYTKEKEEKLKVEATLKRLEPVIYQMIYENRQATLNKTDQDNFRFYKKAFKYEFLIQIAYGYSLKDIIESLENLMPAPNINPLYIIRSLRENGYFYYENVLDQNSRLILTPKAYRYLETEANKTLKR